MVMQINVRTNISEISKKLDALAQRQIPFATAQALTAVARAVAAAEKAEIKKTFPTATPFTLASVGSRGARKTDLQATVFLKDITAMVLEPYEFSGVHHLNSRALLNPKNVLLNQYGNLPRSKLATLKGKANVFVGQVKTKAGDVSGVWQRIAPTKGKPGHLKLLIRFGDALPVKQHLEWRLTARQVVARTLEKEFGRALGRAIASAK